MPGSLGWGWWGMRAVGLGHARCLLFGGWVSGWSGIPMVPLAPDGPLSVHRASWVFLVCMATPDARAPR